METSRMYVRCANTGIMERMPSLIHVLCISYTYFDNTSLHIPKFSVSLWWLIYIPNLCLLQLSCNCSTNFLMYHYAVTGQWRYGNYTFDLLVALVASYKAMYLSQPDSYTKFWGNLEDPNRNCYTCEYLHSIPRATFCIVTPTCSTREISLYVQWRIRVDVGHIFGVKTNPYLKIKYTFWDLSSTCCKTIAFLVYRN